MTITSAPRATDPSTATAGRLYLVRAVIALIWAGLLAAAPGSLTPDQTIPASAVALLIGYPLIDVVSSLVDARASRQPTRNAMAQYVNAAIGTIAAVAIAFAASSGADAVLRIFGSWALLTGLIQLTLAVSRRGRGTPGQLPMIISGVISSVAGIAFVLMSTQTELNLLGLAGYATAGAIFFLVSAWRLRSRRDTGLPADSAAHS